jgi:hypothetical protein
MKQPYNPDDYYNGLKTYIYQVYNPPSYSELKE